MVFTLVTTLMVGARGSLWPGSPCCTSAFCTSNILGVGMVSLSGGAFSSLPSSWTSGGSPWTSSGSAPCWTSWEPRSCARRTISMPTIAGQARAVGEGCLNPPGPPPHASWCSFDDELVDMVRLDKESLSSSGPPLLSKDGTEDVCLSCASSTEGTIMTVDPRDAGPCKSTVEGDGEPRPAPTKAPAWPKRWSSSRAGGGAFASLSSWCGLLGSLLPPLAVRSESTPRSAPCRSWVRRAQLGGTGTDPACGAALPKPPTSAFAKAFPRFVPSMVSQGSLPWCRVSSISFSHESGGGPRPGACDSSCSRPCQLNQAGAPCCRGCCSRAPPPATDAAAPAAAFACGDVRIELAPEAGARGELPCGERLAASGVPVLEGAAELR
mmetsp:Transcript_59225/g.152377  ORF Transcript_59225/g.152377 Transcript_59225/m.152377 type:complete len:381 (-) Transcript_59225:1034-2176(-)